MIWTAALSVWLSPLLTWLPRSRQAAERSRRTSSSPSGQAEPAPMTHTASQSHSNGWRLGLSIAMASGHPVSTGRRRSLLAKPLSRQFVDIQHAAYPFGDLGTEAGHGTDQALPDVQQVGCGRRTAEHVVVVELLADLIATPRLLTVQVVDAGAQPQPAGEQRLTGRGELAGSGERRLRVYRGLAAHGCSFSRSSSESRRRLRPSKSKLRWARSSSSPRNGLQAAETWAVASWVACSMVLVMVLASCLESGRR